MHAWMSKLVGWTDNHKTISSLHTTTLLYTLVILAKSSSYIHKAALGLDAKLLFIVISLVLV